MANQKSYPNTNLGWHRFYVARFNKTGSLGAEYLATMYLYMHLAFGDTLVAA